MVEQWTFLQERPHEDKNGNKRIAKRISRKYFRTTTTRAAGAGSTGENEPGELSTEESVENKLVK
jgi:hypothetical protein